MALRRVVVHLLNGETLDGESYEMDFDDVQDMVSRFLQAEDQGTFVIDAGKDKGWYCVPTRSINYVSIEPAKETS